MPVWTISSGRLLVSRLFLLSGPARRSDLHNWSITVLSGRPCEVGAAGEERAGVAGGLRSAPLGPLGSGRLRSARSAPLGPLGPLGSGRPARLRSARSAPLGPLGPARPARPSPAFRADMPIKLSPSRQRRRGADMTRHLLRSDPPGGSRLAPGTL